MNWPLVTLADIAPSKPIKLEDFGLNEEIWQITLDQIESNTGRLLEKSVKPLSEAGSSTHAFDKRFVLYSKLRPYLNKVLLPDEIGVGTTELIPMLPDSNRLDRGYLAHYLKSKKFVSWISSQTAGAKMPRVSMKVFWSHAIPLPPLKEQKHIATILDKADAIRRKRQQSINLTDQLLRSVFLDMFGDPGFNSNKYDELRLGEIIRSKMNNGIFRKNHDYGGSVPVAWVGELFVGEQIDLSDSRCVEPTEKDIKSYGMKYGDILFCRSSLKLGGIGWNNVYLGEDDKALFECHLIRMSPDMNLVNPIFLSYQLRLNNLRKRMFQQAKTVTMTTIDQDGLSNVRVMVPPIDEQNQFANFFIALNDRVQKKDDSLKGADNLFESLTQSAFRGELTNKAEAA